MANLTGQDFGLSATFGQVLTKGTGGNIQDGLGATYFEYVTGSWTPVISDGTNDAVTSFANGRYTRIGRMVFCQAQITLSSLGSVSGNLRVKGLPITVSNDPSTINLGQGMATIMTNGNIAAGTNISLLAFRNDTYALLQKWSATTGTASVTQADLTATTTLYFYINYYV